VEKSRAASRTRMRSEGRGGAWLVVIAIIRRGPCRECSA
jgi:hypothetical protein